LDEKKVGEEFWSGAKKSKNLVIFPRSGSLTNIANK